MIGFAGYSPWDPLYTNQIYAYRQVKLLSNVALGGHEGGHGASWDKYTSDWGVRAGDSGGPIFRQWPDGVRDVVGVLTQSTTSTNHRWTDITYPSNELWIRERVTEGNVPVDPSLTHSAYWLDKHGKTAESWWGEVDYTGPCQLNVDRDCDGWWDHNVSNADLHDNCPYIRNPDQLDSNNNGAGDKCDACPWDPANNPDMDDVCEFGPPWPTFWKKDNCPNVFNPSTSNCNEDAERAAHERDDPFGPLVLLGDACDPVPCAANQFHANAYQPPAASGGHPQFGGYIGGRVVRDQVETKRIAPHKRYASLSSLHANQEGLPGPLADVTTKARFCQSNTGLGFNCRAASVMRDEQIEHVSEWALEENSVAWPWHRALVTMNVSPARGPVLPRVTPQAHAAMHEDAGCRVV